MNAQDAFNPALIAADFETQNPPVSDVLSLAQSIDLTEALTATGYGAKEQRDLGDVADTLLKRASSSALEDVVDAIHALQEQIAALDVASLDSSKGFLCSLFSPKKRRLSHLRRNYTEITYLVDRLSNQLMMAGLALQKEMYLLDTLYEANKACYHALHLKILAGEQALADSKQAKPEKPENTETIEKLFSNRLDQLRQSKLICLQMAAQIRLTQHNQQVVIKKLKQTIEAALPLWKNQLALALNIDRQQEALGAYRTAANQAAEAMSQAEKALKEGTGEVSQESKNVLSKLERLKETDLKLKQLMEDTLTSAQQVGEKQQT